MAGEWQEVALGEVCTKIGSGATPRGGRDVYLQNGPYSLIRSQNVHNDGFHRDGLAFIGDLHADELQNVEVFEDDVLLNITGDSVARVCQVAPDVLPARVNQHVAIIRPDSVNLDPGYLRYFLASPQMQSTLLSWAGSGGTRNALTKGMIETLEIPLPPFLEQRTIAHVLGTLDDKIELNRRMNETLESMARALFTYWFVDFDPVRAKMDGRWRSGESLPGLPAHFYDRFPDRLVDSELGPIPEGWEVKTLGELADVTSGKRPNARSSVPSTQHAIPLWGGNGPMAFVPEPLVDHPVLLTGRVGTLGSVFRLTEPCWPSDNTLIVTPHLSHFFNYLYLQMGRIDFESLNRGSTQPLLTQGDLKSQLMISLSSDIMKHFHDLTTCFYDSHYRRKQESDTLATQRDELLPKLVSGVVRVGDTT